MEMIKLHRSLSILMKFIAIKEGWAVCIIERMHK